MKATFSIWRGDAQGGAFRDYATEVSEGMVVLDAVHRIQAEQANDLAVRTCVECFRCPGVCHVPREHQLNQRCIGPRFFAYVAALEMHPLDTEDRVAELKEAEGIGLCNISKCCTRVCPEDINITDNAIIPLKERVVDRMYDPLVRLFRLFRT